MDYFSFFGQRHKDIPIRSFFESSVENISNFLFFGVTWSQNSFNNQKVAVMLQVVPNRFAQNKKNVSSILFGAASCFESWERNLFFN